MGIQVPGAQWIDLQGLRGSRGWCTGSQGVKESAHSVPGGQGVGRQGPRGSRGRPTGSKGVKGSAQRVGFFNIGSGRVGYWTKYRVAGRARVG